MTKAKLWIQEMIEHPEWGRTENKWDAINEISRLIENASNDGTSLKDRKIFSLLNEIDLLERENKALAEESEIKCSEIERLKKQLNNAFDLLDGYNQAFVNMCSNHPRITKEEWGERVMSVV